MRDSFFAWYSRSIVLNIFKLTNHVYITMHNWKYPFFILNYFKQILNQVKIPHEFLIPRVLVLLPFAIVDGIVLAFSFVFVRTLRKRVRASIGLGLLWEYKVFITFPYNNINILAGCLKHIFLWGGFVVKLSILLFLLEIDLSKYIILQRMCYVISVGKIEALWDFYILKSLDICRLLLSGLWRPARHSK